MRVGLSVFITLYEQHAELGRKDLEHCKGNTPTFA